ncbi:MAG: hypothetical protein ACI4A5_02020 [Hominilimicola sp.]
MIYNNNDPAALFAMEEHRLGSVDEYEPAFIQCPCCGSRIDTIYGYGQELNELIRIGGEIVGCNLCVEKIDPYTGERIE